jgi:hypothetical protein
MRRRTRPTGCARKTTQRAPVTGFPAQLTPCVVFRVRATSRSARRGGTARCRPGGDAPTADPLHAGDRPVGSRHSFVAAPLTCEIGRRRAEIAFQCRFDGQASAWLVRMDRDSCTRREASVPCGSCQPPSGCTGWALSDRSPRGMRVRFDGHLRSGMSGGCLRSASRGTTQLT